MNWDAIGAIAEIPGSFTVVITIVYLTVQIRQSSKAAKSVSTNQTCSAVVEVISAISSNTDAVKAYAHGLRDRALLEIHERLRFDLIIFQTLRASETIFLEYQEGLVRKNFGRANGVVKEQFSQPKAVGNPGLHKSTLYRNPLWSGWMRTLTTKMKLASNKSMNCASLTSFFRPDLLLQASLAGAGRL